MLIKIDILTKFEVIFLNQIFKLATKPGEFVTGIIKMTLICFAFILPSYQKKILNCISLSSIKYLHITTYNKTNKLLKSLKNNKF